MANVNIKFNGKEFLLSCEDGQEEHLEELSINLNKKFKQLKDSLGNIGENKLLLITSIQMIDDYFDLFQKVKKSKEDFKKLSSKFIELKSLAINFKDDKEIEIGKLRDELNNYKIIVEENKNSYEKILDKTTESIEKFIENAEIEKEQNI